MSLKDSTNFVVVEWIDYELSDGKKAVELVPVSWLNEIDNSWFRQYPDPEDYNKVVDWVLNNKKPSKSWNSSEVKIVKQAKTHSSGLRRLSKSFQMSSFTSSEEDRSDAADKIIGFDSLTTIDENEVRRDAVMTKSDGEYMELKITTAMKKYVHTMKSSLMYEIKKSFSELQGKIAHDVNGGTRNSYLEVLDATFPIEMEENFNKLEKEVASSVEKKQALIGYISCVLIGVSAHEVPRVPLNLLIGQEIQALYSAFGRKTKGQEKKNFSATQIYKCLLDVLREKYYLAEKDINSRASRWFSNQVDRFGGRAKRAKISTIEDDNI